MKNKVYPNWAFKANEEYCMHANAEAYKEIMSKYRVYMTTDKLSKQGSYPDYDLVIERCPCYNHSECIIVKNDTDLSNDEIALVCDGGNLCFGYKIEYNGIFYIFED